MTKSSFVETSQRSITPKRFHTDLSDPLMLSYAMKAQGVGLCAYLVALAAFQRGLSVTFHYELASERAEFQRAKVQGFRGELFTISDGNKTHAFSRTLGDLTGAKAIAIGEDKHLSKIALKRAGISSPTGICVKGKNIQAIKKFLQLNSKLRFVVKPHNGTMGKDVFTDLSPQEVLAKCKMLSDTQLIIEEYISGIEYRSIVAGYRFVGAFCKTPANVIGDGINTIDFLIQAKNNLRRQNPWLGKNLITELDAVTEHISKFNMTLESIPSLGEKVELLGTANGSRGGDPVPVNDVKILKGLEKISVLACRALEIPVSGLDIIVKKEGGIFRPYVLELNQRPHIGALTFPMEGGSPGNIIGDAIIDFYFPHTVNNLKRKIATFDFSVVASALRSAQISKISLPTLTVDHRSIRLDVQGENANRIFSTLQMAANISGINMNYWQENEKRILLSLIYHKGQYDRFFELLPQYLKEVVSKADKKSSRKT